MRIGLRRSLLVMLAIVGAALLASPAGAAIDNSITSPSDGAHSLSGIVPVEVDASASFGIQSVQLEVDGQLSGFPVTTPVSGYDYEIDWDTSGVSTGTHTLSVLANSWSEGSQLSAPITVDVGPAYPTISLSSPAPSSFASGNSVTLVSTITYAVGPAGVVYTVDGNPVSSPWDSTTVADGTHTIAATVTDGRGKTDTATVQVTVDNTPPSTSITSPSAHAFVTGSLSASTTASDAYGIAGVQYKIDGIAVGSPLTAPDSPGGFIYSTTIDISSLANGPHTLSEITTDNAGNTATDWVPFNVGVAPLTGVQVTAPPDISFATKTVTVTATALGGTPPFVGTLLVDGVPTSVTPVETGSTLTFQWDSTSVLDGSHTLNVSVAVTDSSGTKVTSPDLGVTVDNTAPTTFIVAPTTNAAFTGSMPVQANASDAYGIQSVQFAIDNTPVGPALTSPDAPGTYTYSASLSVAGLANGPHTLTDTATDNAGNPATSAPVTFYVGSGPPVASITAPPTYSFAGGTTPITVTASGGTGPYTGTLLVDGNATSLVPSVSGGTLIFQWPTHGVSDGVHALTATIADANGQSVTTAPVSITVDNTAPEGDMYLPAPAPGYTYARTNGPTLFQVHASDANGIGHVQFLVDGTVVSPAISTPDPGQSYLYSYTFDTSTLPVGLHAIQALVVDNAGNSTLTAALSLLSGPIDTTPPTLTLSHAADGQLGWNLASPVTETVDSADPQSGLDPVSPQCSVDGTPATLTSAGTGAWTFPVAGVGLHGISCISTDNAGNKATAADAVIIDDLGAAIAVRRTPAPNAAGWNNTSVNLSFTCSDPVSGVSTCPTPVTLVQGAGQSVTGTAKDGAGRSTSVTVSGINIDTTPPSLTLSHTADGQLGWNLTSPVTETVDSADALSGLDAASPQCSVDAVPATLTPAGAGAWTFAVTGAGTHSIACVSTDLAGNTATAADTVSIDDLGAAISVTKTPAPNAAGWNDTPVKVSYTCVDPVSGVASCPAPVTLVQGAGQSVTGTAKDVAGKSTSVTVSGINIDTTPPVVTVTGVASGATYLFGAAPVAACTTTDALSGVAVKATALVTGGTAGMGLLTATCSGATDVAGNAAPPVSVTYTVGKATPTVTWKAPAAINYGTALSATQLNATASVPGAFSYSPAAGTVLLPGAQTLSVTFTPTNTAAYNSATATVPLTVGFPQACVTGTLGTNGGNVLVATGKSICLSGSAAKLIGSVTIQSGGVFWVSGGANVSASVLVLGGGTFGMIGGTLSGNINAGLGTTVITNGATILGPVLAQGAASFCADKITGPVTINLSSKPILFGGTTSACGGNTVVGSVLVTLNSGGVGFSNNTITGPLNVVLNKGGFTYGGNTIHGTSVVTGNS